MKTLTSISREIQEEIGLLAEGTVPTSSPYKGNDQFRSRAMTIVASQSAADRVWLIEKGEDCWEVYTISGGRLPLYLDKDEHDNWLDQVLHNAWNRQQAISDAFGSPSNQRNPQPGCLYHCLPILVKEQTVAVLYLEWYQREMIPIRWRQNSNFVKEQLSELYLQTERIKELEIALAQQANILSTAREQLSASDKLASLGLLTTSIAHEIRNTINFISTSVQPLKQGVQDMYTMGKEGASDKSQYFAQFQELMELLEALSKGAKRTQDIVKGVGAVSKNDGMKYQWARLNDELKDTLHLLRPLMKERIELETDWAPIPEVYCKPGRINQVFMNLLGNAIHAIEGDGRIRIKTGVEVQSHQEMVYIAFQDNGIGIAEEKLSKIFEPFFTENKGNYGTGLGLAISKDIIKAHAGRIEVESEQGKGTTFTVWLPVNP